MKNTNKIQIEAPCRVHLTLIAMDQPIYRANSGIGFAIDGLNLKISASLSENFLIIDKREKPFSTDYNKKLIEKLKKIKIDCNISKKITITIKSGPPSHSGFGIGTAITLSLIEAYLTLSKVAFSKEDVIRLSCRGGTSGIGIHAYFQGGFIFDAGMESNEKHQPSSQITPKIYPKIVSSLKMPIWEMGVFLPANGKNISGESEVEFFNRICPITHEEANEVAYHAIIGTLCSIVDENLILFAQSINNIQKTKWKREELKRQGLKQIDILKKLNEFSLGAAMSSLGPAFLVLSKDYCKTKTDIQNSELSGDLYRISPNNQGRILTHA